MNTRYVVLNEHTLGYIYDAQPHVLGILHASVLRGSTSGRLDGTRHIAASDVLRPATLVDFAAYRVVPPPGFA